MKTIFCCDKAQTTAYQRYKKYVTRVSHSRYFIDRYGFCEANGTTLEPNTSLVPAASSRRLFGTQLGVLFKMYMCPECHKTKSYGLFKTKAEALATHATMILCDE